jgi:hypothetical protein
VRGQLCGTKHVNKGTKFSFFKSNYVDDTAFILLSGGELVTASKLIVSHFRRLFGLTIHTGSRSNNEGSKTEAIHFPTSGQELSAADTEDIEIDDDRFMSFCIKFKCLGTCMSHLRVPLSRISPVCRDFVGGCRDFVGGCREYSDVDDIILRLREKYY